VPKFSGGRQLAKINRENTELGSLISGMIDAMNRGLAQAGVSPVGQNPPPPPPNALAATVIGEQLHLRVTDNSPTNRARRYFAEIATDPSMSTGKVVHPLDATRSPAAIMLPTYNSGGVMQAYYAHVYSQDPGSPPSAATPYPVAITMNGVTGDPMVGTQGDLPASTGSGTASTVTPSPAQGYGVKPTRAATGPKRTV
jgi:hypothetical protein